MEHSNDAERQLVILHRWLKTLIRTPIGSKTKTSRKTTHQRRTAFKSEWPVSWKNGPISPQNDRFQQKVIDSGEVIPLQNRFTCLNGKNNGKLPSAENSKMCKIKIRISTSKVGSDLREYSDRHRRAPEPSQSSNWKHGCCGQGKNLKY